MDHPTIPNDQIFNAFINKINNKSSEHQINFTLKHKMVQSTLIARLADGLQLAASMDDSTLLDFKSQAKALMKSLSSSSATRGSVDSGTLVFHYIVEFGVVYLVICEGSYPGKLAFVYLDEIQR